VTANQLPLLVIVSGAPGSGKTTLAEKLAAHMRLLHLERDVFFRSLEYTAGKKVDRETIGIPRFYEAVTRILSMGASLIIDSTLYKGISEDAIIELQTIADVVNVHCRAVKPHERFYAREVERARGVPQWLPEFMPHLEKIHPLVVEPLVLAWDTIEVETTTVYKPTVSSIAKKLADRSNPS